MKIYRYFHFLSFDIVLGAMASSCLAARLFNSHPGWVWWISLPLTVWLIYTNSQLMAAWRNRKRLQLESQKYLFKNRSILLWTQGLVTVIDLLLIFNFLPHEILKYALVLAGAVLLFSALRYLLRKSSRYFVPGELFVLVIYMAGTWLGPLATREGPLIPAHALITIGFSGVLFMNLGIISLYDKLLNTRLGIASIKGSYGKRATRNLVLAAGFSIYLLNLLQFLVFEVDRYFQFTLILSGMATILLLVLFLPTLFRSDEHYRWTADAVLSMGFLTLLIALQ